MMPNLFNINTTITNNGPPQVNMLTNQNIFNNA